MKISILVKELEKLKQEAGDVDVRCIDADTGIQTPIYEVALNVGYEPFFIELTS